MAMSTQNAASENSHSLLRQMWREGMLNEVIRLLLIKTQSNQDANPPDSRTVAPLPDGQKALDGGKEVPCFPH
jgi:hypothetical protein